MFKFPLSCKYFLLSGTRELAISKDAIVEGVMVPLFLRTMKILRAIGFAIAIIVLKVLMSKVFGAFEGALISLFTTFQSLMGNMQASL